MSKCRPWSRVLAVASVVLFLAACDVDPFNRDVRQLPGGFVLRAVEDEKAFLYFLEGSVGGRHVQSSVTELGWSEQYIVAKVSANALGNGWVVIDVRHHEVTPPLTPAGLAARGEARGIRPVSAAEAFKRIPWSL
jgi:hypothetical protein